MKSGIDNLVLQSYILDKLRPAARKMYTGLRSKVAADGKQMSQVRSAIIGGSYNADDPTNNTFWTFAGALVDNAYSQQVPKVFACSLSLYYPPSALGFGLWLCDDQPELNYNEPTSNFNPWIYPQLLKMQKGISDAYLTDLPPTFNDELVIVYAAT